MKIGLALLLASSLAAIAAAEVVTASADSCTALVLSGGGANGAWEAGVLYGLYHD
jgi:predicted acylesterase/phospholipase RssA